MKFIRQCKDPSRIVAFSGHRRLAWGNNDQHPHCIETRTRMDETIRALVQMGKNTFLNGLALGADVLFAQEVLRLRAEGLRIYLVGAIPSEKQAAYWKATDREFYGHIRGQCDALYVHDPSGKIDFGRACLGRNDWMVDNSSALVAFYNGRQGGGTAHTCLYATKHNRPIINLWRDMRNFRQN